MIKGEKILNILFTEKTAAKSLRLAMAAGRMLKGAACSFLCCLAIFQLVAVPFVLVGGNMDQLVMAATFAYAMAFFIFLKIGKKNLSKETFDQQETETLSGFRFFLLLLLWGVFILLLFFELYKAVTMAPFDGDDAYYIVQSVSAYERGELYRTIPYTGFATSLDARHALAVFPLWIAYLSRLVHVHPAIMAHSILPLLLIPVTYVFYGLAALELWRGETSAQKPSDETAEKVMSTKDGETSGNLTPFGRTAFLPGFLILICLLSLYGRTSIFTVSTFLVTRTWQGKSVLANCILASACYLLCKVGRDGVVRLETAFLMICAYLSGALCTTLGVFLLPLFVGGTGVCLSFYHKSWKLCLQMALCAVPALIYGLLYLIL